MKILPACNNKDFYYKKYFMLMKIFEKKIKPPSDFADGGQLWHIYSERYVGTRD
jgi:hypothetical protein